MTCLYPATLLGRLREWWHHHRPCRHQRWTLDGGCPDCGQW